MKFKYIFLIIQSLALIPSFNTLASSASCEGPVKLPGSFIDVTCTNGWCYGSTEEIILDINGDCENHVDYSAQVKVAPMPISGHCYGNQFSGTLPSQELQFYGLCMVFGIDFGSYSAEKRTWEKNLNGYCNPNGMARIFIENESDIISGKCR